MGVKKHMLFSISFIQNILCLGITSQSISALDEEMNEELGYSKYDYRNKETDNSRNGYSSKNYAYQLRRYAIRYSKRLKW